MKRKEAESFRDLIDRYDGFLVDQWGVLHNGVVPYPGAVETLEKMREAGKRIVIISNSGKRSSANATRMEKLGFPPESYDELVTSGEVAWQALKARQDPLYSTFGERCLLVTSEGDDGFLEGLNLKPASEPEGADFVILASIEPTLPQKELEGLLGRCLLEGLPIICTNPDRVRITPEGTAPGTGALAERYQKRGGTVSYIGKPHPKVYEHCRRLFSDQPDARLLCIGDSLQHDIRGGRRAGYHTAFISGGIFAEHFKGLSAQDYDERLKTLMEEHEAYPDWVFDQFVW